jgi:ATP-binding protein involved in chromosome partitioning
VCADYGVPFLGALPLDRRIREETDGGKPTVVAEPDGPITEKYREIARQVAIAIADRGKDFTHKMPTIVVRND